MDDFRSDFSGDWVRTSVLKKYGDHLVNCRVEDKRFGCTCGWNDIADKLSPLDEEEIKLTREYNTALANGLVGKARMIARRFKTK